MTADVIGTEDILGAFIAGIALNRVIRARRELREHLEFAGRLLFIPFFFVETGMRLELAVLTGRLETWALAGLLLCVVTFGKSAAAWLAGSLFGYTARDRLAMASLALPRAAATLAVVVTGSEMGLLDEAVVDAIIVLIFVTCLLGPLGTRFAGRRIADDRRP